MQAEKARKVIGEKKGGRNLCHRARGSLLGSYGRRVGCSTGCLLGPLIARVRSTMHNLQNLFHNQSIPECLLHLPLDAPREVLNEKVQVQVCTNKAIKRKTVEERMRANYHLAALELLVKHLALYLLAGYVDAVQYI